MVVIGDPQNPAELKGGFSVQVSAEDFVGNGAIAKAFSRGFNLHVDAGAARAGTIHFLIVRLEDGLRTEGFVECVPATRKCAAVSVQFASLDRPGLVGRLEGTLHWDGNQGILTAQWTLPRI